MPLSGNKGEWSEVYVLLKLLSDLKLFSADEDLNKTESYLDVLSIQRLDIREFKYLAEESNINVIDAASNECIFSISRTGLTQLSRKVFAEIKAGQGSSFTLSEGINNKLNELSINRLKEKSNSKGDINIYLHDPANGINTNQKFSIKSFIGSDPTLFNANRTTNIIYEIKGERNQPMSNNLVSNINSIQTRHKYIDRVSAIESNNFQLHYYGYEDQTFKLNLELIDSKLPEIIAFAVLEKYRRRITRITDVINNLTLHNPLKYDLTQGHNFYEYRIINFLVEVSLGMTSAFVWNGIHDATGGIIIVKDDSEVLCYHLIEFNKFKAYLKKSARLDNPSGGKMGYGKIENKEGKSFIKLNFQVKA